MMGESDPQRALFYQLSLEKFVPQDHPLRRIRPLIDDRSIRRACRGLYSLIGRPSIPPEQLFLALVGGYLLGIPSDRKLVMELQCNMALRWFVGLNLDQDAWDASTFSQNRRRRFDESGVLERQPKARRSLRSMEKAANGCGKRGTREGRGEGQCMPAHSRSAGLRTPRGPCSSTCV